MQTGRLPCKDKGRDVGDASTSQGMPVMDSKPPETERGLEKILAHGPREEQHGLH